MNTGRLDGPNNCTPHSTCAVALPCFYMLFTRISSAGLNIRQYVNRHVMVSRASNDAGSAMPFVLEFCCSIGHDVMLPDIKIKVEILYLLLLLLLLLLHIIVLGGHPGHETMQLIAKRIAAVRLDEAGYVGSLQDAGDLIIIADQDMLRRL
jgi:hypothetical protein